METPRPPERLPELPSALTQHVGYLSVVMGQHSQELFETAMEPLGLRPVLFDYLAVLATDGAPDGQVHGCAGHEEERGDPRNLHAPYR